MNYINTFKYKWANDVNQAMQLDEDVAMLE